MVIEEFPGEPTSLPAGLAADSRVAGYRLEQPVGAGGMAVVFRRGMSAWGVWWR
jgi:hypothetical protein